VSRAHSGPRAHLSPPRLPCALAEATAANTLLLLLLLMLMVKPL
jgi:hypothetical protein